MRGSSRAESGAGALRRISPPIRSEKTGSMSSDAPSSCTRKLAWPSQVSRGTDAGVEEGTVKSHRGDLRRGRRAAAPPRQAVQDGPAEDGAQWVRAGAAEVAEAAGG